MTATKKKNPKITFIDLFAGIGGTRTAFERAGCRCVFSSEWDKYCQKTYADNFGEIPRGDITSIDAEEIQDHDILVAGFPCQPFSISGVSKKNSLNIPHGFDDPTQGTLFFELKRIIAHKNPRAFLLENVKHLKGHDGGRTFGVIMQTLEEELGYTVFKEIIDARAVVPQHRERIFIVGFRDDTVDFRFPKIRDRKPKLRDILDKTWTRNTPSLIISGSICGITRRNTVPWETDSVTDSRIPMALPEH